MKVTVYSWRLLINNKWVMWFGKESKCVDFLGDSVPGDRWRQESRILLKNAGVDRKYIDSLDDYTLSAWVILLNKGYNKETIEADGFVEFILYLRGCGIKDEDIILLAPMHIELLNHFSFAEGFFYEDGDCQKVITSFMQKSGEWLEAVFEMGLFSRMTLEACIELDEEKLLQVYSDLLLAQQNEDIDVRKLIRIADADVIQLAFEHYNSREITSAIIRADDPAELEDPQSISEEEYEAKYGYNVFLDVLSDIRQVDREKLEELSSSIANSASSYVPDINKSVLSY